MGKGRVMSLRKNLKLLLMVSYVYSVLSRMREEEGGYFYGKRG
jgi:hypothetical protein